MDSNVIFFPDLSKKIAHISINASDKVINILNDMGFEIVYIM